jgi:hypothetical protein
MSRVVGWLLDPRDRTALLARIPPAYPDVVAHHVTLAVDPEGALRLPVETAGEVIGIADDGAGVQALVVRIAGGVRRPDGGVWHITWSLASGRRAVESNSVIAQRGWRDLEALPVRLRPARF